MKSSTDEKTPPENGKTIPGTASARGSLDKEIIRGVVRLHMGEVKECYERELPGNPGLSGRAEVQFTIAATGQVVASVLQSSTLGNARVENCVVQAVRGWEFPKPHRRRRRRRHLSVQLHPLRPRSRPRPRPGQSPLTIPASWRRRSARGWAR